ncbi:tetratricopeptide repeat-containing sulfotransferase family protein [uncultured Prochlorococcus sp.]|uniref:tetratricopeptide repeat-containing sulfotransferase family protein n=1 Tax=uncultured Prochlorococcus sp. TaxID=159733 RepID=UPI0025875BEE|nr:tetratricopeptide repeat-containing sulfotransferase family protein [uncultured Prochlorococcus sp.]
MKKIDLLKKIEEAKIKQKSGNTLEANQIFQALLKSNNDSFDLLYAYGLFCRDLKNFNLAKKVFLILINKFPLLINPYILLAEILKIENKFKDAEKILLKAIKIDPNHGDLLYNFALLYFALRNFDYALVYIDKAIKLSINNDTYKLLKSEIYINKSNIDEALYILEDLNNNRIKKDKNKEIRINILLANAKIKKREFEEAEKILLKLIKKYQGLELAYLNLSILYKEKNQLSKGIQILKKGINVSPDFMPFYKNLATFYRNSGQLKLAIETNLFIISRNKFDFNSFYELSGIYDFKNHKNELNFLLNTKLEKLNPNSKIYAAFAISNLLHKEGKFKESAKYLKIANDESTKYKKSDLSLKKKHTEFYRSLKIKNSKNKYLENSSNYIFIVGMPRSGSTLLENILSLNPEVTDLGEVNFLEESIKETEDFEDVYDLYQKKVINQFQSSIIYTDKNLFNYIYCPIISYFFPNAKIINCIRNPLDNILSIYRANFLKQSFSFSLTDISSLYVHYFETMEEYKIKYGENIYDYHYEDLIENPHNIIPGIINWLDWDWDEKYLSPHQNKRNVHTASSAQIRKKFYSSSIGIWKEYKELLEPAIEIIKTNKILRDKIS